MTTGNEPRRRVMERIRRRVSKNTGFFGRLRGRRMAKRYRPANLWAIRLLNLRSGDRVLDIGCGAGMGVAEATRCLDWGLVAGIDQNGPMVAQAIRRNRKEVRAGLVEIRLARAESIPYADGTFTAAFAVNSASGWSPTEAGAQEARRVLAPGGRLAIVTLVRKEGASRFDRSAFAAPRRRVDKIAEATRAVGFRNVRIEETLVGGQEHVAILARR